jgi:hypothetical protein
MKFKSIAVTLLAAGAAASASAQISPGSVVVYRIGNGTNNVLANSGSPVFVDVYSPTGSLTQSIALPTTGANALLASGTATSEGGLTVSPNGRFITITGYNRDLGSATTSISGALGTVVPRSVAVIDSITGNIAYSTFTDFSSGNNARSAVTDNGINLWMAGGTGGIRYGTTGVTAGTTTQVFPTTPATLANFRQVNIFGGQLYASNQSTSGGNTIPLGAVGTGLPTTSGAGFSALSGLPALTGTSMYSFFFADLSSSVAGDDTLYIADDGIGISKYSLVGGTWVANGVLGVNADDYRGITGVVDPSGGVNLFATRLGGSGAAGGGELVSILDIGGYNAAIAGTPSVLSTAITSGTAGSFNTAFRGVGYVIPTPGTAALLGLAGVFAARRRRN